jgi:autotransporter adhesin
MKRVPAGLCALALGFGSSGAARAQSVVDVCTGLSVNLPVLQPIAGVTSGLLAGLLDPVLNGVVGDVNLNLRNALSGRNIGLTAIDQNGNLVTAPGQCGVKADRIEVESAGGIAIGGGRITGLGSTASPGAAAADQNAIAFGHGASTSAAATGAVAVGLRGTVTAADGVAIGRDTVVSAAGGIALGAGSTALRGGLSGGREAFSGIAVASTQGALSIGSAGNERQIANVAGGTQATDAVNLRQLRAVGDNLATSLGGGARFAGDGSFTGPSYALRSGIYGDVGSALAALDRASGVIAGNNTGNHALAAASGSDALAAGYGSAASGARATAVGTQARASGSGSVALGAGASATGEGATAIGAGASATRARQVALGTAASSYSLPGLATAASRAAQSGPTQVVTTDAAGNLAAIPVDIAGLGERVDALGAYARETRKEARQGVAAAMAMSAAAMPSQAGRTSWAANTATFKGEWAAGFAVAHRLAVAMPIAVNAGVSLNGSSFAGARVGVSGEF